VTAARNARAAATIADKLSELPACPAGRSSAAVRPRINCHTSSGLECLRSVANFTMAEMHATTIMTTPDNNIREEQKNGIQLPEALPGMVAMKPK